jgi:hypothetical protein
MTDRELEQQIRAWYAAEVGETEPVPDDLRERVGAIPATTPTILRPRVRRRNFTLLAVAAVLVVGGLLAAGSGVMRRTPVVTPPPNPAVVRPTASLASELPTPTTNVGRAIRSPSSGPSKRSPSALDTQALAWPPGCGSSDRTGATPMRCCPLE